MVDAKRKLALQSGAIALTARDLSMLVTIMEQEQSQIKIKQLDELDIARLKAEHPEIDEILAECKARIARRKLEQL